ncbi:MAG: SPFH domain-containing protein [Candidatus Hydrogenedentes bacterium]|nr:SPFH domain-containing protein [Candidatus Hydrogenedentota bacterium]
MQTQERQRKTVNGWLALTVWILVACLIAFALYNTLRYHTRHGEEPYAVRVVIACVIGIAGLILCAIGFFTLQPNEAAVLVLFGKYTGTVRVSGFHWANPFLTKLKVSLRARNLNGATIKVNDLRGNPIEIAAVVVWRVQNTAQAVFDVDSYDHYVTVQSEAALRHLASAYPYDIYEGDKLSLRGSMDEVSGALKQEVQERVARAGVLIEEARLSHLAYAPEIAHAMLQRQQAEAIVAARSRIVDGAVGMVEMALDKLQQHKIIEMDPERRAAMVSNLLVVLCSERAASPVVNTGTLYT